MIPYARLRDRLRDWPKYPGCRPVARAPIITRAFPGTFNLSFTEHHWLQEYGGLLGWDHDYVFTTIQSCIRIGDFALQPTEAGPRYLGVFEMADLCGAITLRSRPDYHALQASHIGELVRLLGDLGIPPERIHPSYSAGGRIIDLTAGRYRFDCVIPPDLLSREAFLLAGVPHANLIADATRATLLSLHLHRPTPWGYRNEIHVNVGAAGCPVLINVATVEYLLWRPRFRDGEQRREEIVGVEPLEGGALLIACGLERLAMVANGLGRVHDVDYLRSFYEALEAVLGRALGPSDYLAGESLRALHRILADLQFHPEADVRSWEDGLARLSIRRRRKLARLKRCIPARLRDTDLERLLLVHARAQPWHDYLDRAIEPTCRSLGEYRDSRARRLIHDG